LRMYLNGASELVTHSFRANQMRAPPALFAKKELVNFIYCTPVSQSCIVYDMHPTWQLLETGGLPMVCQAGRCSCGIMSIATRNLRIVVLICRLLWLQSELVKVMFHQSWLELFAGDQDDPHDRRGYINDK
jgi:hypothetical protein